MRHSWEWDFHKATPVYGKESQTLHCSLRIEQEGLLICHRHCAKHLQTSYGIGVRCPIRRIAVVLYWDSSILATNRKQNIIKIRRF